MTFRTALFALSLTALANCKAMPTTPPPTPTPAESTAAASLQLLVSSRSGADQRMNVSAEVLTSSRKPVAGVAVTFAVTNGTLTEQVVTTDADGYARTIASANWQNTISASVAGFSESFKVVGVTPVGTSLTVSINAPSTIFTNDTFSFGANVFGGSGIRVTRWNFGDGHTSTANDFSPSYRYGNDGSYTVSLDVTDDQGRSATASKRITVLSAPVITPPIITLAPTVTSASPSSVAAATSATITLTGTGFTAGATVAISGTNVTVSNVTVVSGTTLTANVAVAAGAATGARQLTVTASGGTSAPRTFTVSSPIVTVTIACTAVTALRHSCTATPTYNGVAIAGALVASMTINWGDLSAETATAGAAAVHNYALGTVGNYSIRVTGTLTTGETFAHEISIAVG